MLNHNKGKGWLFFLLLLPQLILKAPAMNQMLWRQQQFPSKNEVKREFSVLPQDDGVT
jgi:hypothetical protein